MLRCVVSQTFIDVSDVPTALNDALMMEAVCTSESSINAATEDSYLVVTVPLT
jgi:hypothetical protein